MGKVINFPNEKQESFLACLCGEAQTNFEVILELTDPAKISALLCSDCGNEIPVNNGLVGV